MKTRDRALWNWILEGEQVRLRINTNGHPRWICSETEQREFLPWWRDRKRKERTEEVLPWYHTPVTVEGVEGKETKDENAFITSDSEEVEDLAIAKTDSEDQDIILFGED